MINAELLNRAGVDYSAGLERFMNDLELYEAVLTAFIEEDMLERAQMAFESGDRARLLKVVHEAKGSGGNAGLDALYAEASALVALLRRGDCADGELREAYRRFARVYDATRAGIRAALGRRPATAS